MGMRMHLPWWQPFFSSMNQSYQGQLYFTGSKDDLG